MNIRVIVAATALIGAGAFAMPTAASAEAMPTSEVGSSILQEHGVAIPGQETVGPRYSVTPEGGGSWTYGTDGQNNTAYSNFYHASRKHGSSVQNGRGLISRSADTGGGATARSSITKTFAGNNAYYRFVK